MRLLIKNIKELFQVEETAGSSYKHPDVSLGEDSAGTKADTITDANDQAVSLGDLKTGTIETPVQSASSENLVPGQNSSGIRFVERIWRTCLP